MTGKRVIFKVNKPPGTFSYPFDLKGTQGTIVMDVPGGGSVIECDADHDRWAFGEEDYEVIDDQKEVS